MTTTAQARTIKSGMIAGFAVFGLAVLAVIIVTIFSRSTPADAEGAVTDFASCAASGRPILESYPERCIGPNGYSYTNN